MTGTNGKTSTVEFCRQLWVQVGWKAASMGTLGTKIENNLNKSLIKSSKKGSENRIVNNVRDAGESYYKTYENIKKEKGQS